MNMSSRQLALVGLILLSIAHGTKAEESGYLTLGAGVFDLSEPDDISAAGMINYHFAPRFFADVLDQYDWGQYFYGVGPIAGLMVNSDEGLYGYGGIFLDIRPNEAWVIWPSLAVGGYDQNDSKDLGGVLEFRSELFAGYRVTSNQMIGVSLEHISNASFHDDNPGANQIYLTWSIQLP